MDYRARESYCSELCQHPTCWEGHRLEESGLLRPVEKSIHKETLYEGLPTQKILNLSMETDDLPYNDESTRPVSIGPGFPVTLMERILKNSKSTDNCVALKGMASDRPASKNRKAGIQTFRAEDLIGDWSEAVVPNKFYIWVPSAQKLSEQSRNLSQTAASVGGKMAVKTISVNASQSHPTHRFVPSAHKLRLRQKSQHSGSVRMRSSKENSSFLSTNVGLEPHYVSLNSSALDHRSLPCVLSRAPTITLPDSSLPIHKSLSHPLSGAKNAANKNTPTPAKQVEKDNANAETDVDPLGETHLPRIDATKYGRAKTNLVKQSKLSSILLEPCFDYCQRKSWTSGMLNYGSSKLNLEPSVSATQQLDSTEDDPDFLDAQKWFKIEAQPLHSGPRSIRVPFGHQNQSSSLGNNTAQPVTTPTITTPTAGITLLAKPVNELTEETSGSTANGLTRSATLMSPLRRTTSKVVTFAPSSRSLSSCTISLAKSPNTRRNTSATSLRFHPSRKTTDSKYESNNSDQPAQPPYPPPPSPELKCEVQDGGDAASKGPGFLVDRGDSESVITITARPPTNFEDESVINTPGESSLARSRESTRDRLTRRTSVPQQPSGTEETEGGTFNIDPNSKCSTETSGLSREETRYVETAIAQLASEIVADVLTSACYNLTKFNVDSFDNGADEVGENNAMASQNRMDKSTETFPDVDMHKAANVLESPEHYRDSSVMDCPVMDCPVCPQQQPPQLEHNNGLLDEFDATEEDFKKELREEYDKL